MRLVAPRGGRFDEASPNLAREAIGDLFHRGLAEHVRGRTAALANREAVDEPTNARRRRRLVEQRVDATRAQLFFVERGAFVEQHADGDQLRRRVRVKPHHEIGRGHERLRVEQHHVRRDGAREPKARFGIGRAEELVAFRGQRFSHRRLHVRGVDHQHAHDGVERRVRARGSRPMPLAEALIAGAITAGLAVAGKSGFAGDGGAAGSAGRIAGSFGALGRRPRGVAVDAGRGTGSGAASGSGASPGADARGPVG
ncbi:MAG: hypothetical protein H6723_08750 [Sandaracinus sp.]|nr:hypothetical protein [Sandaracinus sp.]